MKSKEEMSKRLERKEIEPRTQLGQIVARLGSPYK